MRTILAILAVTVLAASCGQSATRVAKTADGLEYHPSPGLTGDGLPAAPDKPAQPARR